MTTLLAFTKRDTLVGTKFRDFGAQRALAVIIGILKKGTHGTCASFFRTHATTETDVVNSTGPTDAVFGFGAWEQVARVARVSINIRARTTFFAGESVPAVANLAAAPSECCVE
jgi:hypothetical protein